MMPSRPKVAIIGKNIAPPLSPDLFSNGRKIKNSITAEKIAPANIAKGSETQKFPVIFKALAPTNEAASANPPAAKFITLVLRQTNTI